MLTLSQIMRHALLCRVHACYSGLSEFWRKPLASLLTVCVIGIALAIPAVFWVGLSNLKAVSANWHHTNQITLFLQQQQSHEDNQRLVDYLNRREDIAYTKLITPDQGLQQLALASDLSDLAQMLPENPLPAVIEVQPKLATAGVISVRMLANQLQALPEVEKAKLDSAWLDKLHAIERVATKATQGFMLLLAVAVLLVISNTMRLAVLNRYQEIEVLKLIGATNRFIRRPFVYSGMVYGFLGALSALIMVDCALIFINKPVIMLSNAYHADFRLHNLQAANTLLLLLVGIVLGGIGASLSVKRQIAKIEPS